MTLTNDALMAILIGQLDQREHDGAVAYVAAEHVSAGDVLNAPRLELVVPWDALIGFVDREPMANWSHSCRYVLVSRETGELLSVEAELPPFGSRPALGWRVAYRAPSVPAGVLPDLH
ncbi:MAG: hypothetical protein M3Y09_00815 [Actinomycetota bacterium]|nr:hypothetical protein [Actinomycetota bacterium]